MLRIYIAVGYRSSGSYKILVYPEAEDQTGKHRSPNSHLDEQVHWTVSNTTETALTVRIQNFRKPDGSAAYPIDWQNQEDSVSGANNAGVPGRGMIKGKVKNSKDYVGTFDYDVKVGTVVVSDPKLRVDNGGVDPFPRGKKKSGRKK